MEIGASNAVCVICCCSVFTSAVPKNSYVNTILNYFILKSDPFYCGNLSEAVLCTNVILICEQCLSEIAILVEIKELIDDIEDKVHQSECQFVDTTQLSELVKTYHENLQKLSNKSSSSDEEILLAALVKEKPNDISTPSDENPGFLNPEVVSCFQEFKKFRDGIPKFCLPYQATSANEYVSLPNNNELEFFETMDECSSTTPTQKLSADLPLSSTENLVENESLMLTITTDIYSCHQEKQCPECDAILKGSQSLRFHLETQHGKTHTYKCDSCTEAFSSKQSLTAHCTSKHTVRACPFCKKMIKLTCFKSHRCRCPMRPDSGTTCHKCGVKVKRKDYINHHLEYYCPANPGPKKGDELEPCSFCGKVIKKKTRKSHKLHCPARPLPRRNCSKCGATLKGKWNLTKHLRSHCPVNQQNMPTVNLQCDLCGKDGFFNETSLKLHKKRHLKFGKFDWICDRCGGRFNSKDHLVRHQKKCDGSKKRRKVRWSSMCQPVTKELLETTE